MLNDFIVLEFEMIRECGDNRENADLFQCISGLTIDVILFREVEERVVVVIDVINADLEDTLAVVFLVRLDKLHADIKMVERFHAEIVFLTIILHKTGEVY